MLKKLIAAIRKPFHVGSLPPSASSPVVAAHEHSFSCACGPCAAETARLTRARLKRQGA
jgi:hypothetical protein